MVMVTPGSRLPVWSVTFPLTSATPPCPNAGRTGSRNPTTTHTTHTTRRSMIGLLLGLMTETTGGGYENEPRVTWWATWCVSLGRGVKGKRTAQPYAV